MLVVDTCILIDIADDDPEFGLASAECLLANLDTGLTISPITYVEMAPVFDRSSRLLEEFLTGVGVRFDAIFDLADRSSAFSAWGAHISKRRAKRARRRPVADVLIGALALRKDGLITRNEADFRSLYPELNIVNPAAG